MIMLNDDLAAVNCTTSSSDVDCLQNACLVFLSCHILLILILVLTFFSLL